ncbi:unnamed protein product [Periconia digitata]|uniref:Uncharacterized protein n=1 Tax=Periconia digitata TaxID=1303443 RepID=A0A9W4UE27_9PLEO|nr:unnamed protein product [Periconia digitata]
MLSSFDYHRTDQKMQLRTTICCSSDGGIRSPCRVAWAFLIMGIFQFSIFQPSELVGTILIMTLSSVTPKTKKSLMTSKILRRNGKATIDAESFSDLTAYRAHHKNSM